MIEAAIREAAATTGIFPSAQQLRRIGRNDLANSISRRGGFIHWSERLGIARADSDSDFGWSGEIAFQKLLESRGYQVVRSSAVKAPFDLLVDDVLRVDVKTANKATYGTGSGWYYRIGKIVQADLVVLYQFDTGEFYGLPWHSCNATNITVSAGGGKYAAYRNNWDLILKMIEMRKQERLALAS